MSILVSENNEPALFRIVLDNRPSREDIYLCVLNIPVFSLRRYLTRLSSTGSSGNKGAQVHQEEQGLLGETGRKERKNNP